jgi:hypothetical protein
LVIRKKFIRIGMKAGHENMTGMVGRLVRKRRSLMVD